MLAMAASSRCWIPTSDFMSTVNATIAGRQFRLACEDGQEEHLQLLAQDLDQRIEDLRKKFGEIGDTRLTVMSALMVADELAEATRKIRRLEEDAIALQDARVVGADRAGILQSDGVLLKAADLAGCFRQFVGHHQRRHHRQPGVAD